MDETFNNPVYSKQVIEFTTVANEYCTLIENCGNAETQDLIDKLHKILPLLYLKSSLLPVLENDFEEFNEKYVTEMDYNRVRQLIEVKLGEYDRYEEVFDPLRDEHDQPALTTISENIADIYQDIKDYILLFQVGTTEVMHEAVRELVQNYEEYWGQKLVNCLRALHHLKYTVHLTTDMIENDTNCSDGSCSTEGNWMFDNAKDSFEDDTI